MNEIDVFKRFNAFAIAPFYNGFYSSQIWTYRSGTYYSTKTVNQLMDYICIHFGADLDGRLKAARQKLNIKKNPPIIVSEELGIVGCQLPYMKYNEPMWVFDLDFKINPVRKHHSEIEFINNQIFSIKLSADKVRKRKQLAFTLLGETKYYYIQSRYKQMVMESNEMYRGKIKFESDEKDPPPNSKKKYNKS